MGHADKGRSPFPPSSVPWGVAEGLALVAANLLLQMIFGLVFGADEEDLAAQLQAATVSGGLLLVVIWVMVHQRTGGGRALRLIGLRRPRSGTMGRALAVVGLGFLAYAVTVMAVVGLIHLLGVDWQQAQQTLARLVGRAESPGLLAFACLVAVLVAPVVEEVLFRSALYLPLRARFGVVPAALVVSGVFAAVHFYPWGVASLVVLSLTFVALLEVTGTLWAPIVVHAVYNGLTVLLIRLVEAPH
jgi:hypothetical protein